MAGAHEESPIPIDERSHVPVFEQIAEHVRSAVAAGVYRSGELIPSIRATALELRVNPNTVQRAYEVLEREGTVVARKGIGMCVAERARQSARGHAETATRTAFEHGIRGALAAELSKRRIDDLYERAWSDTQNQGHV